MRRVVFVGNCQVEALGQLYSRFGGRDGERVAYVEVDENYNLACHRHGWQNGPGRLKVSSAKGI